MIISSLVRDSSTNARGQKYQATQSHPHAQDNEVPTQRAERTIVTNSSSLPLSSRGRLVKDRATGKPKLTCRNWECGVLVPTEAQTVETNELATTSAVAIARDEPAEGQQPEVVGAAAAGRSGKDASVGLGGLSIFRDRVPVPMLLPGQSFTSGGSPSIATTPWFFQGG